MRPSVWEISPSTDMPITSNDTPIIIGTHFVTVILLIKSGANTAETPITKPTLLMLLPTIFPKINSVCELNAASIAAANSGVDVP